VKGGESMLSRSLEAKEYDEGMQKSLMNNKGATGDGYRHTLI